MFGEGASLTRTDDVDDMSSRLLFVRKLGGELSIVLAGCVVVDGGSLVFFRVEWSLEG